MAKSNNQKAKILYLEKMLRETGEHHAISMQTILANLMEHGIRAERKSIYDDVEVLREFGMDIRYTRVIIWQDSRGQSSHPFRRKMQMFPLWKKFRKRQKQRALI